MQNLAPSPTKSYTLADWRQGYESITRESAYWVDEIEGEIPPELCGTLFRNGPGLFEIGGVPIKHPFDGDGMVCAIAFQDGRAHFRNRFVRTEAFLAEQKAGKMLYRGVFGTQKPGGWLKNAFDLRLKNIANTNVIHWGGKLLALWEAAQPYRLNPDTLETEGLDDLDGLLKPGDSFSAHPRVDPACEMDRGAPCLVNFAIKTGLSSTISLYEIDPSGQLLRQQQRVIPGFAFVHDFAITPHYCIFFQNPVAFNPIPFLLGLRGAGECLNFQSDKPTRIIIVPRTSPSEPIKVLEAKAGFIFHHANAFELEGNRICIDSIAYASLSQVDPELSYKEVNFDALAPGQLWRFTLDLEAETVDRELIDARCCEFPTLNPACVGRNARYLYIGTGHHPTDNAPLQGVLKLDLATRERQLWSAAPRGFVSEPIFVPKPEAGAEDDGWLLVPVIDASAQRSDLVILEAGNLSEIARLHLRDRIPYGLHGSWSSECFLA
ncbi:carotenoid oxygenase family protein [Oscillatoria sp. FACHB-1406]|uniref:carotenoid oxygenase family protein n=1 Tax=Oscillatoria sp. FACHB-1406 TaxID=2692846 RepID=UPI001682E032|nr:carotenoid oxygenase family protein [Oscillatoria sp. FACHB-1406]MBD2579016.1 carotenoid oxygenase family protein [Oscillatoria sp. FACHB-1406]